MKTDQRVQTFKPRFIHVDDLDLLGDLWRLSRTARSGDGKHARKLWTAAEFAKQRDVMPTAAYKDLDAWLEFPGNLLT